MHPPRVPLDFRQQSLGYGHTRFLDRDTGMFWPGLVFLLLVVWCLWRAFQPGGEFSSRWPMPPIDRDHPILFWTTAAVYVAIGCGALYFCICGLFGMSPGL
ncbi:MAG TPA: hypothetical protein VGG48_08290 [Rhizomicrobium sp.]